MGNTIRWSLFTLLITSSTVFGQYAFPNRTPLPQGQDIVARDGDRVIIEDDARVRVVRRHQGMVRTVFNSSQRWLIVLIDYAKPGEAPDGGVDMAYTYHGVEGEWPLGERWEGFIALEEYLPGNYPSSMRLSLITPLGLVQLKTFSPPVQEPGDPSAIAVLSCSAQHSAARCRRARSRAPVALYADDGRREIGASRHDRDGGVPTECNTLRSAAINHSARRSRAHDR